MLISREEVNIKIRSTLQHMAYIEVPKIISQIAMNSRMDRIQILSEKL